MVFICYAALLWYNKEKKYCYLLSSIICVIVGLITGSRKVIIAMFIIVFLHTLLQKNINTVLKKAIIVVMVGLCVISVISSTSWFGEIYGDRLYAIFNGNEIDDNSIIGRQILNANAMELFYQHPIFGGGVDAERALNAMRYFEAPAHNNYAYMLGDFGLIGATWYYFPFLYCLFSIFKMWKSDKSDVEIKYLMIALILILILDFSGGYCFTLRGDIMYAWMYALFVVKRKSKKKAAVKQEGRYGY